MSSFSFNSKKDNGQKVVHLLFLKKLWRVLCLLRIDFFLFLFQIGTSLIAVPVNQLVQDKICLNNLFLNHSICNDITNIHPAFDDAKKDILEASTFIKSYQYIVSASPAIFLSLFLGRWMDLYPGHMKYLLSLPCFGGLIQSSILIYQVYFWQIDARKTVYSYISYGITGGETLVSIGSYTYVARKTAIDYRPLRFAVIEFFRLSAYPLANALGAKLLSTRPWFGLGFRNYIGVFIVFGLTKLITALWVLVTLHDAEESDLVFNTDPEQPIEWRGKETNGKSFVSNVFSLSNLSQTFQTLIRTRPNAQRAQLWHLILASSLVPWSLLCDTLIGFQFAQKVYGWNYEFFSYVSAVFEVAPMLFKPIATYVLIHRHLFRDVSLAALGNLSMFIGAIIRGVLLQPLGYYITIFTHFTMSLGPIGLRSIITRVVDYNEIAQVYAIISLVSSISPIIGTIVITNIFAATIETYPGIVYHFIALTLIYPLMVILGVDLTQRHFNHLEEEDLSIDPEKRPKSDSFAMAQIENPKINHQQKVQQVVDIKC
ncbi:uncharacterized protein LOC107366208 [Tetranychus urticae]|uniref:Major facilitator superfamily (MFS) profile domain-containing protein n=1 Tax=Tetranychus urticae TaxID=32264 RepID=T1KPL2_TETUR|nr:uncharacterized protein LOC107366208 [Tetranychus urticae]